MSNPTYRKKLIEVSLPLSAINSACHHEKSVPRRGHPATMHLWWARRPLAACRAVLFAQLVDDPSAHPDKFPTEADQKRERERLFKIIEELVKWENSNNQRILEAARAEILKSTDGNPPPVLDPFCGGGSIPLEAQRLGLRTYASDLNPVAVLITKALIEIPPKFAGMPPVNPGAQRSIQWKGAKGLAEDVRYYGKWVRDEAEKLIGHLYPKVKRPKDMGGGLTTVVAWLWARTIRCSNPACAAEIPLARSFKLSTKKGKEACISPIVNKSEKKVTFKVLYGIATPQEASKLAKGANFRCLVCGEVVSPQHVKSECSSGHMDSKLMAVVAEGARSRIYLDPNEEIESIAKKAKSEWKPEGNVPKKLTGGTCYGYGLTTWGDLFSPRQLVALNTLSNLVVEARNLVYNDALMAGMLDSDKTLANGGTGALAYAEAVTTYLSFALDKNADWCSTICTWIPTIQGVKQTFARQAIPMTWDFAETNPFSNSTGNYMNHVEWVASMLNVTPYNVLFGSAYQDDARSSTFRGLERVLIATDPPYYDNIGYADLSDFFYVWLRRSLGRIYPELFSTMLVPKTQELVAAPYRFAGDRKKARKYFEKGLGEVFESVRAVAHDDYPITLYYAFKQAETRSKENDSNGHLILTSTGWETMLEGLLKAKFEIVGTWPLRTERDQGLKTGTNVLASSVVLACRPRPKDAPMTTRRDFINTLKQELPKSLKTLQQGNIAPVDLAQSVIGPGMALFSRYSKVLEAGGTPMRVRSALALINQVLDEYLSEQEGEYDADTRWALAWFEQHGMEEGPFGIAETLSKAKNIAVAGLVAAGVIVSKAGKVRILRRDELSEDWDPATDKRLTAWEITQHLIRALVDKGSEEAAASLLKKVGALGDVARDLAYRLYTICDRKKWAQEALAYNSLVVAWPELIKLAGQKEVSRPSQQELFEG